MTRGAEDGGSALDVVLSSLGSRVGVIVATCAIAGRGRAAERLAGNRAARSALERAGERGLIGRESDGRPRWPAGWAGSIAHAGGYGVAAVCPLTAHRAVGVDIEQDGALDVDDARLVLTSAEMQWVLASARPNHAATLLWSAKESAFKAWSGSSEGLCGVDPLHIHIDVQVDRSGLTAYATGALARDTCRLGGGYATSPGFVVTLMADHDRPTRSARTRDHSPS